jgi:hypothetical protein
MWDPSGEMKNSHQKTLLGQIISYIGHENDHILLILMGHMQNNIRISNSLEKILFPIMVYFRTRNGSDKLQ